MSDPVDNVLILTADPDYSEAAWQELLATDPGARRQAVLAPGVWLARAPLRFGRLGELWRTNPPIFVRHICPVETMVELDGSTADPAGMARIARAELSAAVPTGAAFSVQTRLLVPDLAYKPFAVNDALAREIVRSAGGRLDVRAPQHVISVVVARLNGALVGCLGASPVTHNLSAWAGGERRFRREDGQISRAEFKLLEALEQFGLDLPERGMALDLGAAPGGWTRVLRQRRPDLLVTAIDPGDLHESLRADWGVRHIRTSAELHLRSLGSAERYDWLLNDMRLDARRSARLLVGYAPHIKPHGRAIMTAKLPEFNPLPLLQETLAILRSAYAVIGVRQLFHNRNEVTIALRPAD